MCYNVEPMRTEEAREMPAETLTGTESCAVPAGDVISGKANASVYCPICFRLLERNHCKLDCACGYYMSCSDYY